MTNVQPSPPRVISGTGAIRPGSNGRHLLVFMLGSIRIAFATPFA
jgi:hypothetical protein